LAKRPKQRNERCTKSVRYHNLANSLIFKARCSFSSGFSYIGDYIVVWFDFFFAFACEFASDKGSHGGWWWVRDQKVVGIEDQLAQMTVGGGRVGQRQDKGFAALSSPSSMPV